MRGEGRSNYFFLALYLWSRDAFLYGGVRSWGRMHGVIGYHIEHPPLRLGLQLPEPTHSASHSFDYHLLSASYSVLL